MAPSAAARHSTIFGGSAAKCDAAVASGGAKLDAPVPVRSAHVLDACAATKRRTSGSIGDGRVLFGVGELSMRVTSSPLKLMETWNAGSGSALHMASYRGVLGAVEILLEAKADPNSFAQGQFGHEKTPLQHAIAMKGMKGERCKYGAGADCAFGLGRCC